MMFEKLSRWFLWGGAVSLSFFIFISFDKAMAVFSGYTLSTVFVLSSIWVVERFSGAENKVFIKAFFLSTIVRFIFVLLAFALLLSITKIHEIFFTVSFIISYLFQSVTEMIFINKILRSSS